MYWYPGEKKRKIELELANLIKLPKAVGQFWVYNAIGFTLNNKMVRASDLCLWLTKPAEIFVRFAIIQTCRRINFKSLRLR